MSINAPSRRTDVFLIGGGEMGKRIRRHDWEATSLGRPEGWPQALRTVLRLILNTGHPMYIFWGPESCVSTTTPIGNRLDLSGTLHRWASRHVRCGPRFGRSSGHKSIR